jgi:putative hydrolase of the HAD superfamily
MSELEPDEVELRRAGRERALELLYEAEIKDRDVEDLLRDLPLPPAPLAEELVRGVAAHRQRIDETLARRVAPRWSVSRLANVDRAILRLATYELMEATTRSQAIIINEAVILARRFGSDDSPRFVNGVLSAVAAEVRPGASDAVPTEDGGAATASAPVSSVDALVVDLDGVIRHWDEAALPAADAELGLPAGAIAAAAFEPERLERAMRGDLEAAEWSWEVGAQVAKEHGVDPEAVARAFTEVGWRIDEAVMELVAEARRSVPVALLSNASSRLVDDLRRSGILDRFDAVVGSADVGVCKPEPAAFRAVAERLGVGPEDCLFVDDTSENLAGAEAVGMQTVHFTGVDELEQQLTEAGLLTSPRA